MQLWLIMKLVIYFRLLLLSALLLISCDLNAQVAMCFHVNSISICTLSYAKSDCYNLNEKSHPINGGLIVLAEYTRAGMRYNPSNNEKKGGCMLKISRMANDDGTQEHYAITGYAVDNVDGQWIWHNCLSNSVKYNSVKGVYTAFVNGLGNVYFSI